MLFVILITVGVRGFFGRIAIFVGLVFAYLLSAILDWVSGDITAYNAATGKVDTHPRVNWDGVTSADWFGFPRHTAEGLVGNQTNAGALDQVGWHLPSFSVAFTLLVLPAVIALIAENTGHVKAVA